MGRLRQTSIRWKPELKKQVEHALVERDMSLQAAIDEALELWLRADPALATSDPANLRVSNGKPEIDAVKSTSVLEMAEKVDSILEILKAGHRGEIDRHSERREDDANSGGVDTPGDVDREFEKLEGHFKLATAGMSELREAFGSGKGRSRSKTARVRKKRAR